MNAGLLAEWASPDELVRAARVLRERGYTELDAFTPCPVPELEAILALRRSPLNWIVFPIGAAAAATAYLIQWYCNAYSYPLDVGDRPAHAAPAFIPITFETLVLAAAISSLVVLCLYLGLPRLAHPMFEVEGFERASIDRYWLAVGAADPLFNLERVTTDLRDAGALRIAPFGGAP